MRQSYPEKYFPIPRIPTKHTSLNHDHWAGRGPRLSVNKSSRPPAGTSLPLAFSWWSPEVRSPWPAFPYRWEISNSERKNPSGNERKTVITGGNVSNQMNELAVFKPSLGNQMARLRERVSLRERHVCSWVSKATDLKHGPDQQPCVHLATCYTCALPGPPQTS